MDTISDQKDNPRRKFLKRGIGALAGVASLGSVSTAGALLRKNQTDDDLALISLGPVDVPGVIRNDLALAQAKFSSLGHRVNVSGAHRWMVRLDGKRDEFTEVKAYGVPVGGEVAALTAMVVPGKESRARVEGVIRTSDKEGRWTQSRFFGIRDGSFELGVTVRLQGSEIVVDAEPGWELTDRQRRGFVRFARLGQPKLRPLSDQSGVPSPAPTVLPEDEALCRLCRDLIIAVSDTRCIFAAANCIGCCVAAVYCAPLCPPCSFVAYQTCYGDLFKNMGCRVCTAFRICRCPCGSYC